MTLDDFIAHLQEMVVEGAAADAEVVVTDYPDRSVTADESYIAHVTDVFFVSHEVTGKQAVYLKIGPAPALGFFSRLEIPLDVSKPFKTKNELSGGNLSNWNTAPSAPPAPPEVKNDS